MPCAPEGAHDCNYRTQCPKIRKRTASYRAVVVYSATVEGVAIGSSLHASLTFFFSNRTTLLITVKM
jgi:hypothetical protein